MNRLRSSSCRHRDRNSQQCLRRRRPPHRRRPPPHHRHRRPPHRRPRCRWQHRLRRRWRRRWRRRRPQFSRQPSLRRCYRQRTRRRLPMPRNLQTARLSLQPHPRRPCSTCRRAYDDSAERRERRGREGEGGERGGRGDCREGRVSGRGFDGGVCCDASRPGDANEGDATGSEGWGANGWRSGEPGGWDCCGAGTGTRRMILWGWADGSGERRARHFLRCVGRGAPGGNAENIYSYKKILTLFRQRAPHSDSD